MQSKAIELTCLTQLAQYGKRFMALDSAWVQSNTIKPTYLTWVAQNAKRFMAIRAIKAIELSHLTLAAQDAKCLMALGAIEGNRTHLFDLGSSRCQVLHGLEINLRQSNSPDLLRWCRKAIEFTCMTQVAQDVKCCMTWRSIKAIKLTQLTLMAQNAKCCMVWRSIEGNRTHPFDSGGAVCQALHGLEINRRQSNSPV